jgi:hypothetical protein
MANLHLGLRRTEYARDDHEIERLFSCSAPAVAAGIHERLGAGHEAKISMMVVAPRAPMCEFY